VTSSNVILTGVPRSSTTLTCHLLNKLPNTVALHEPMNVSVFPHLKDHEAIGDEIARFFDQTRESLQTRGVAISKHVDGEVPDNPASDQTTATGLRVRPVKWGEIVIEKDLEADFLLAIKHPSAFTAVLESLIERFPCYAVIRNPLSVLASWNCVPMPVEGGHVPAAERLDHALADALQKIDDKFDRQLHILSWFLDKYRRLLPREHVLRYEDTVASGGKSLRVITPRARELNEELQSKNRNKVYDPERMKFLGEKLLNSDGAYWEFYSRESVEELLPD
jgi:hypothetical protein